MRVTYTPLVCSSVQMGNNKEHLMREGKVRRKDVTYAFNPVHDLIVDDISRFQPCSETFKKR